MATGTVTATDVVVRWYSSLVARDIDGDGDDDLLVISLPTEVFRNDAGTFVQLPSATWDGSPAQLIDVNGDGWLDLAGENGMLLPGTCAAPAGG